MAHERSCPTRSTKERCQQGEWLLAQTTKILKAIEVAQAEAKSSSPTCRLCGQLIKSPTNLAYQDDLLDTSFEVVHIICPHKET
jgi:hypothetical protein